MAEIRVQVGEIVVTNSGHCEDTRVPVVFNGEELAQFRRLGTGRNGGLTDTRGTTQTLYRVDDGRLVVYVEEWSRWQGEPNTYRLFAVTENDLRPGGRFDMLGHEAGFWDTLTLDDALQPAYHDDTEEIEVE